MYTFGLMLNNDRHRKESVALTFQSKRIASMHDTLGQRSNRMGRRTMAAIPLRLVLASRNLFHDRIRFVATTVGVVFSVILVTVQLGLYVSCQRMITAMIDRAQADLWIVPMNARSFEDNGMLEGQERFQALATPGVTDAIPLLAGFSAWRRPDGGTTAVIIVGISTDKPGLRPWNFVDGSLDDLTISDGIIIDRSYFKRLNRSATVFGMDDVEEVERKALESGLPMEGSETPEAALIAKADANRLEAAIAQLPVPFREALVLRDVQGLDYREIAQVIKVPIGTVMSRLARARSRLIAGIAAQEGVGKT